MKNITKYINRKYLSGQLNDVKKLKAVPVYLDERTHNLNHSKVKFSVLKKHLPII